MTKDASDVCESDPSGQEGSGRALIWLRPEQPQLLLHVIGDEQRRIEFQRLAQALPRRGAVDRIDRRDYASNAILCLTAAHKQGAFPFQFQREGLRSDPELAGLLGRPEFVKLLSEITGTAAAPQ